MIHRMLATLVFAIVLLPRVTCADDVARLEALDPTKPVDYLVLAEEMAENSDDAATIALAREVAVRGCVLAARSGDEMTAASSAFLLADIAATANDRAWLYGLGVTLDRRSERPEWLARSVDPSWGSLGYRTATVIGLVRSGDGVAAKQLLADQAVVDVLRRFERLLNAVNASGGLRDLQRNASLWPCKTCHNERALRRGGGKDATFRICPTCEGDPGPRLTNGERLAQLRFESALLHGIQRSWSAQLAVDGSRPLIDPTVEDLDRVVPFDRARLVWRNGAWSTP